MKNECLDKFGEQFVCTVRDYSIKNIDKIIQGKINNDLYKNIYKKLGCVLKQNIAQIQEMLYSKRKL